MPLKLLLNFAFLNTFGNLFFYSDFLKLFALYLLIYCFSFSPKYVCLFLDITLVTHLFGKPFCLASCTSTLQSLGNVHFCFTAPCVERTSDKEIPLQDENGILSGYGGPLLVGYRCLLVLHEKYILHRLQIL